MEVLYLAAHGGFAGTPAPLGGGAAVCDRLIEEWSRSRPFSVRLLEPSILGALAPSAGDIVRFGERAYADFCRHFERAATARVMACDPAETVVLCNDVSEGPDFSLLAARGYHIATIFHVDVVAYVARIYGHGCVRPRTLARWGSRLEPLLPRIARLIFVKQRDAIRHSRAVIVPSGGMCEIMLGCYPETPPEKIRVIPWGVSESEEAAPGEVQALRREYGVPPGALVLLALSRISPEKGTDLLLEALIQCEERGELPAAPLLFFVCGEAAYMQGRRFHKRVMALAARLRKVRVVFPGHVSGRRKAAFFKLADLYVFPSRHESYGLTLLEALRSGLPAVCLAHHGARAVMRPEFGRLVPLGPRIEMIEGLRRAILQTLAAGAGPIRMGAAAREYAVKHTFADSAAELARVLADIR